VVVLYCQHCVEDTHAVAAAADAAPGLDLEVVMMPCSSKVQVPELLKILDRGADAVEVVACPEKACRFLVGSRRAEKRMRYAAELLRRAGLDPNRVGITRARALSADELVALAAGRAAALTAVDEEGA
jgi:coenzyme F420-reducing hydrogenase delta subunit